MNTNEELRQLAQKWKTSAGYLRIAVQRVPYPEEHHLSYCATVYDACATQLLQLLEVLDAAEQDDDLLDDEHLQILKNVEALMSKTEREE